jgi:hypothetical protein
MTESTEGARGVPTWGVMPALKTAGGLHLFQLLVAVTVNATGTPTSAHVTVEVEKVEVTTSGLPSGNGFLNSAYCEMEEGLPPVNTGASQLTITGTVFPVQPEKFEAGSTTGLTPRGGEGAAATDVTEMLGDDGAPGARALVANASHCRVTLRGTPRMVAFRGSDMLLTAVVLTVTVVAKVSPPCTHWAVYEKTGLPPSPVLLTDIQLMNTSLGTEELAVTYAGAWGVSEPGTAGGDSAYGPVTTGVPVVDALTPKTYSVSLFKPSNVVVQQAIPIWAAPNAKGTKLRGEFVIVVGRRGGRRARVCMCVWLCMCMCMCRLLMCVCECVCMCMCMRMCVCVCVCVCV